MKKEMKYEITEAIEVLHNSEGSNFNIELNRISWNNKPALIDIRRWDRSDNPKFPVGKGVSLTDEAVEILVNSLLEKGYGSDKIIKKIALERGIVKKKQKNNS